MEDDNADGPFTVWHMFNAPTMVLFNNLELAADGLDRVFTSILKLSDDFSEVLVPRPGGSKYPDEYYKAFNTWLIGRLFYVWSVKELERIHISSREAQLKILNILCVNGATFYHDLHSQYLAILHCLNQYYKDWNKTPHQDVVLQNFCTKKVDIPNAQLNLEPIYVHLKDRETCEKLMVLTIQLLSESIPMNPLQIDKNYHEYTKLYSTVLYMLEHYNVQLKLECLKFFWNVIDKSDKVAVTKFQDNYPEIYKELLCNAEAMVSSIPVYYEKCEVDSLYLDSFSNVLLDLLKTCKHTMIGHQEAFITIATVILNPEHARIFNKDLKLYCLSLSCTLDLPEDHLKLDEKDATKIDIINPCYTRNIVDFIMQSRRALKENCWYYRQITTTVDFIQLPHNDKFLIEYHLKRVTAILGILQNVYVHAKRYDLLQIESINIELLSPNLHILSEISEMLRSKQTSLFYDMEVLSAVFDVIQATAFASGDIATPNERTDLIYQLSSLILKPTDSQKNLESNEQVKVLILNSILSSHVLFKTKLEDTKTVLGLVNSLNKNKNPSVLKQLIVNCPHLLINKVFSECRLIGDILMPAFLSKDLETQKDICKTLPVIACIALGSYAVILNTKDDNLGQDVIVNGGIKVSVVCAKCHNQDRTKLTEQQFLEKVKKEQIVFYCESKTHSYDATLAVQRSLFAKFLNCRMYADVGSCGLLHLIVRLSNHSVVDQDICAEIFNERNCQEVLKAVGSFIDNISADNYLETTQKESMFNTCVNLLVHSTRTSLDSNDYSQQTHTLDYIKSFGLSTNEKLVLPSTKLLIYFIMHPQCPLGPKAVVYLRDICEAHDSTPNLVYHRYKKDYCRLFVDCSLYNGKDFALSLLKVVRAFGFVGYREYIAKDAHHFLPYLIPYSVKIKEVPSMIEEIASLVSCSVSEFLIEKFPHVYTHIYLTESEPVQQKCYTLLEKLTKMSLLDLIRRHFRVILTEFLLQYCCDPDKVLNACRYLASHDPDVSSPTCRTSMTTSQVADFLHPKFLGVLAYFDHKLMNAKVALSVKRKALQSFPDIMKLMGVKYLTPLRFKVLATLRSALSLVKEFPKILAAAWSAFIHNIDSMSLGPLLSNLAVSLLQQIDHAPHEINKIFQYLVLANENILSSHISDLFFLEDTKISEKVKLAIKRHVKRTQPEGFLDKVKWYLQHLNQDIPTIKAVAFSQLDKLLQENRTEIHKALFGKKNIEPAIVELIDCLLSGCRDTDTEVSISAGACLGQLGAIEPGHLPRQYVSQSKTFAFSISEDGFAAAALHDLTRAFQYENDTQNMDCYALTIQEILKIYNIAPTGSKKELWDSFPEHMHQIMYPLLSSRYTLAYPSQPRKAHPLFGSQYATTFLEWAYNWAGQLIPLIESESIRELLRAVHPSMRRDVTTLCLFLPYVLLHAVMCNSDTQRVREEILAVIGSESVDNDRQSSEKTRYQLLRHTRMTPSVSSVQTEEGTQTKCSKMIYSLFDFLNRWLLEWCHSKQNPLQNENYIAINKFVTSFDMLAIARGNLICGEHARALQYLEAHMQAHRAAQQAALPFLAEVYALLDEPDSVAGILSIKRSEPSLRELILAQVATGRLQDAALCYERLAQEGPLDRHSLQGSIDCYLGLDQPFTAYRLLSEHESGDAGVSEMAAEALWRLGRFEQLEELTRKNIPPSRENWGLLMGRVLVSYRAGDRAAFDAACRRGVARLLSLSHMHAGGGCEAEGALRSGYQTVLGLHAIQEARRAEDAVNRLRALGDGCDSSSLIVSTLLEEWRRRLSCVQPGVRTVEPLLRLRRTLLHQAQELLQPTHPDSAAKLRSCIGDLWLQSAKYARKEGLLQQAYMYVLAGSHYAPAALPVSAARVYWARGQRDLALTQLSRAVTALEHDHKKLCAKAKLLIAKYNDETTNVDVDVNISYYKDAVEVYKQWEKSLVCLGAYYEKVSVADAAPGGTPGGTSGGTSGGAPGGTASSVLWARRVHALNSYGKALQYGHKYLYQSMPRMLSLWLDVEVTSSDPHIRTVLAQMTEIIKTYSERLPLYLYLTAFSQIISRICHPVKEVYAQLKAIIVKLILAYPQHTLWMMISVMKSSYPQRIRRCQDVFAEPRLKQPHVLKLVCDFTQLAEKLIELCNKPITDSSTTTTVSALVKTLPRLLAGDNFSRIMMPFQEFCKVELPCKAARQERLDFAVPAEPEVYIAGIEELVTVLPSLQKPRKVTLKGSDGKSYTIMLKPKDDLRRDYRLMEFNAVVNRFLRSAPATRRRRLYIRTYSVLPLNEECGLVEWVPRLVGLRPVLVHLYKQKGIHTSNRQLKELMCASSDPVEKKRRIFEEQLLPRHPPVFHEWFRRVFADPYGWYQARSAYVRTTAVMSMVGYILGLGDRHGENISFDSCNGDTVHVDFNCLFNKGEAFEWPERVPFRLTHNMAAAMGPLQHDGMYRKSCEAVMTVLREQTAALMSVIGPFVYDPLVSWARSRMADCGERTNEQALQHLHNIRQRLNGMVRTKNKQLSLSLSPEGQVEHLIVEATSIHNLCQMYIGWGPFL